MLILKSKTAELLATLSKGAKSDEKNIDNFIKCFMIASSYGCTNEKITLALNFPDFIGEPSNLTTLA